MKLRSSIKLIMIVAAFAMILSLASCTGSLKLESFTVDLTSIKTTYLVGEEIDFSGIKAIARYSDESLNKIYTFEELKITYADDITATEGSKEVTVSFEDPNLGVTQQTKITIKVVKDIEVDSDEPLVAVMFEKPSALVHFNSANETAGTLKYGESGFGGQFFNGGKTYVIGNENAFKFNPRFAVLSSDDVVVEVDSFYSVVEIYVEKDGAYVALTKTEGEGNVVTYADGDTLIATVDTYKGSYEFSADAAGKKVKISVLPSAERYTGTFNPVVLEANVIKAYNVYEAWQLAVIDNSRDAWNEIKAERGLLGVEVSGIVLHNDIKITVEDVPASYFYVSENDVVYTNAIDGTTVTIPAGTKFLKEWTEVYRRVSTAPFVIEGNFFTLDTKSFPHIASPAVFGKDAQKDYGEDFSNATLFHFSTQDALENFKADPYGTSMKIAINNLSIMGNAKRDNLIDAEGNLASAGGLIFIKSRNSTVVTMDNIIGNSYFITYFPDCGKMIVNNSKCFDSYQNAAFLWGYAELEVNNSVFDGCGGPAIIAQSVLDGSAYTLNPKVVTNDSVIMANVTGEEIWFTAVKATSIVGQIKGLGTILQNNGLGNFVGADGKMNVQGALMASGSDAGQIISGIGALGSVFVDDEGIERSLTDMHWMTIKTISETAFGMSGSMPPFLTVYDANGTAYTIWTDGTNFYDLSYKPLGTDASHQALVGAFMTADTIVLTQGGLSVVLDFYH